MLAKLSKGYKISSSGAAAAILCFFLPWVLVSCNDQPVASFNGWQLAAGTTVGSGFGASQLPGTPVLFIALLAGFGVLALAYAALRRGHITRRDGFAPLGLGAITLFLLFGQLGSSQSGAAQQGITVNLQYGFWGVVFGYLAVVVGGIVNLRAPQSAVFTSDTPSLEATPLTQPITNFQIGKLNFDLATLRKALRLPLFVVGGLCLLVLINASLGSFWSIGFTLAWAFAGVTYARTAQGTGASLRTSDLALNGGTLAAGAALVYQIVVQIIGSMQNRRTSFDLIGLLATLIEAFVVAALAAVAWCAYQSERTSAAEVVEHVEQAPAAPVV